MTLQQAIDLVAKRTGLLETNTEFTDQARVYLSMAAKRIGARAKWWWEEKTTTFNTTQTITISGITLTFTSGETITGTTSGATATVDASYDATNANTTMLVTGESADFNSSETITGGTSGATATTTAANVDTQVYQLASDLLTPHSFVDQSNNQPLGIVGWDSFDLADPDRDETGDVDIVTIEGVDAVTGKVTIRLYPIHSTSGDVIRYRYLSFLPDWTSANDSTALDRWIPQILQPALIFGAVEFFKQEKGDAEGSLVERTEFEATIKGGLEQNVNIFGNRAYRRGSDTEFEAPFFHFFPNEGGLTAAS